MTSHAGLMVVFAFFVSVVFGTLMRDEPKEQFRLARACLRRSWSAALHLAGCCIPFRCNANCKMQPANGTKSDGTVTCSIDRVCILNFAF